MTKSQKQKMASSLDNYKPLLEERGKLHIKKKEIEARIKKLDEDLRPVLMDRGALIYNGYQFEVASQAGRTTYDYKKMEEDGIDLNKYKKVGAPSTRFTVKEVNEI